MLVAVAKAVTRVCDLCADKPLWHKLCHVEKLWRWLGPPMIHNEEHPEREHARAHEAYDLSNGRPDELLEQMVTRLERCLALRIMQREAELTRRLLSWTVLQGNRKAVEWLLSHGGADATSSDDDGDPVLNVASGLGDVAIIRLLLDAGAELEARDSEGCTSLVLACLKGHVACVQVLLEWGAAVGSKWQHMRPKEWASAGGHTQCVELCETFGDRGGVDFVGHRSVDADPHGRNRLRPPPSRTPRRRARARKAASDEERRETSSWGGHYYVKKSLLGALLSSELPHPELGALPKTLRRFLKVRKLPEQTISSFSIRPGVRLRRTAAAEERDRVAASPTIDASIFGRPDRAPQFVAMDHEHDPMYKHFFGELLLAFTLVHNGERRELCFIKWIYPQFLTEDGVPYSTRYEFPPVDSHVVQDVSGILYRAPLVRPMRVRAGSDGSWSHRFYIMADDIYGRF